MLSFVRPRPLSVFRLLIPTLLSSLFFQSITLCIDPFLFPIIERHLPPKITMLCRWLWIVVFGITLLFAWNIAPGTYLFYLREALPFTPRFILFALGAATVSLLWFVLWKESVRSLGNAATWYFVIGLVLLLIKCIATSSVMHSLFLRQHLRSPVLTHAHMIVSLSRSTIERSINETPDSTFYSFVKQERVLPPNVVLMLVESWGERSDALDKMAEEISARGFHVIKHGFTTYRGSTLSGEFRELCAKYLQPSDGLIDEVKNLQCAPRYMHERQYSVIGMHGYEKAFYARSTFWSRFGVEQQVFGNELRTLPQCPGPFPGTCDENLIGYGIDRLDASNTPTFLYMLTLSSHEPLDPESSSQRGRYFNDIDVAHPTQIVTRRAISELIEKLQNRKSRACTLAYIVGDHQPPSASSKGGIFEPGKVPYLVFSINCP